MSAETDPKLVEEIDAIPTEAGVEHEAEALAARTGMINGGGGTGGGADPQGGPYQTHSEPGGGDSDDPNGGPYQPHQPDPQKTGPVTPTGGPYQTHSEPIAAQN
ncbi:hypothetical protein AB0I60_27935 [Actinosynnema sp. NPDC050436]|uniref:hypothetical protein n=1 Tax=Actinosynnema sp. NPDC050436 TaxID=3155659 RepID=UPI00340C7667